MAVSKPPMIPGTGSPDDTEQAFYDALRRGDVDAAMSVWSDDDDIVCILPASHPAVGTAAVRTALAALLRDGGLGTTLQRVHSLQSHAYAVHGVLLRGHGDPAARWVLATNVYCQSVHGWQLVAHHASTGSANAPPDAPDPAATGLLH